MNVDPSCIPSPTVIVLNKRQQQDIENMREFAREELAKDRIAAIEIVIIGLHDKLHRMDDEALAKFVLAGMSDVEVKSIADSFGYGEQSTEECEADENSYMDRQR